jgi:hypothetical protein
VTLEHIDVGAAPGDGTGDNVREAFEKVNLNFDKLAEALLMRLLEHPSFTQWQSGQEDNVRRHIDNGPPTRSPSSFGALWVDASSKKIYLATGTASAEDWQEIAFVSRPSS